MTPRHYFIILVRTLGVSLIAFAFLIIRLEFPFNFVVSAFSLLIGLGFLSSD